MKRMEIVRYPHPALRTSAIPLAAIDELIRKDAEVMLDLMYANGGVGLSANQVALPFQIIVMNPTGDPQRKDQEHVLLNPVLLEQEGSVEGQEGCLSLP